MGSVGASKSFTTSSRNTAYVGISDTMYNTAMNEIGSQEEANLYERGYKAEEQLKTQLSQLKFNNKGVVPNSMFDKVEKNLDRVVAKISGLGYKNGDNSKPIFNGKDISKSTASVLRAVELDNKYRLQAIIDTERKKRK